MTIAVLNAPTIVRPKKYLRSACRMSPVTMRASAGCMPMCRSIHRPIEGPSLSRKNDVKIVKPRNTSRDLRPEMPLATPLSSVRPISGAAFLMSVAASAAEVIPKLCAHPCTLSTAWESSASRCDA